MMIMIMSKDRQGKRVLVGTIKVALSLLAVCGSV